MNVLGPDGQPMIVPIIGGPKELKDFASFTPEEMKHVALPLQAALEQGVPPMSPVQIEIGMVYRLIATILHFQDLPPVPLIRPDKDFQDLPPMPLIRPSKDGGEE